MMKKIIILSIIISVLSFFNIVNVKAETVAECVQSIESMQNIEPLNEVSAGITPKNIFYFLDGFGDWVKLHLFSFTKDAKINTLLGQAQERVAELAALQQSSDLSLLHINAITESYNDIMLQLDIEIEELADSNKDITDILARVTKLNAKNNLVLSTVMTRVGANNFVSLMGVYNSTSNNLCSTISLWQDVTEQCNDSSFIAQRLMTYYNAAINEIAALDQELTQIIADQEGLADYYDQVSTVVDNINMTTAVLNEVIDSSQISIANKESLIASFIADINTDGNYSAVKNFQPASAMLDEYGLAGVLATANTDLVNIFNRLEDLTAIDNDQNLYDFVSAVMQVQSASAQSRLTNIQSLNDNIGQDRTNLLSSKNSCQALKSKFLKISDALEDNKLNSATSLLNDLRTAMDSVDSDLLPQCGVGAIVDFLADVFAESAVLNSDGQCQSQQYLAKLGQWSRNQISYWDEMISSVDDLADKVGEQQVALSSFINTQQTAVSVVQAGVASLSQRPINTFDINDYYNFNRGWLTDEVINFQDNMVNLEVELAILEDDLQNAQIVHNNLQNNILVTAQNGVNQWQSDYNQVVGAVESLSVDVTTAEAQVAIAQASLEQAEASVNSDQQAVQSATDIVQEATEALGVAQAALAEAEESNNEAHAAVKNGVDYFYTNARSQKTNGIYFGGLGNYSIRYTLDLTKADNYDFWIETLNYPIDLTEDGHTIPIQVYYMAPSTTFYTYWGVINNPASNPDSRIGIFYNEYLNAGVNTFMLNYTQDKTLPLEIYTNINMLVNRVGIDFQDNASPVNLAELQRDVDNAQTVLNSARIALVNAQNNYNQTLSILDSFELELEMAQQNLVSFQADLVEQQALLVVAEEELGIAQAYLSDIINNQLPAAEAEVITLQNQVDNFAEILASGSAEDIIQQEMKADIIKQEINTIVDDQLSAIVNSYQELTTELTSYQNTVTETIALYSDLADELVNVSQLLNTNQRAQAKQQINNILSNTLQDLKESEYPAPAYFIGHNLNVLQWLIDVDQIDFARQDLYLAAVKDAFVQMREFSCSTSQDFYNNALSGFCANYINGNIVAGCDYITNMQMLIIQGCMNEPQYHCGNTLIEIGESCDDGNNVSGDGCSSNCQNEILYYCGDGIIQTPNSMGINEECENIPPNQFAGDGCSAQCQNESEAYCGDGIIQQPNDNGFVEQCDDGNRFASDGCNNLCTIERGQNRGIIIKSIRP
ncbi:MAG: DUF4215 domain-containing protein [Candidatus Komeilibacteria bacterium]